MNPIPMQKKMADMMRKRPAPVPDHEMMKEPPKRDQKKPPVVAALEDNLES